MIPYGKQHITEEDIKSVTKVLKSEYITGGPAVEEFENVVKAYVGVKHAIALSNATAGLHVACLAIGLSKDDVGLTSPITFLASANCIAHCGGIPKFIDIDPKTYCLSPSKLENYLKENQTPKVVIPVDFAGIPSDLPYIHKLSKQYNFKVIEDAAHSLGSTYIYDGKEYKCGSCAHSDIAVFSFHPVKTVTAGEGGMVLTNNDDFARKIRMLANNGIERDAQYFDPWKINNEKGNIQKESKENKKSFVKAPWLYQQQLLGFNYRITDIQSALGTSQFKRIDQTIEKRKKVFDRYQDAFQKINNITSPYVPNNVNPAFHLYILKFSDNNEYRRVKACEFLRSNGVFSQIHYIPVYHQPWYQEKYGTFETCPDSEEYYNNCISIPLFPDLTDDELNKVIYLVKRV